MAEANQFDDQSAERIARSVLFTEDLVGNRALRSGAGRVIPPAGGGRLLGKTSVKHPKGETHPVDLYEPPDEEAEAGEEQPTGETVDAYNRFATVRADRWVHVVAINGGWELTAAECGCCDEENNEGA